MQRVNNLLAKIKAARRALIKAWKAVNEAALRKAIKVCDSPKFDDHKYRAPLVRECRELLERIELINEEGKKAQKMLVEQQVHCVLDGGLKSDCSSSSDVQYL